MRFSLSPSRRELLETSAVLALASGLPPGLAETISAAPFAGEAVDRTFWDISKTWAGQTLPHRALGVRLYAAFSETYQDIDAKLGLIRFPDYVHRGYEQAKQDFEAIVTRLNGTDAVYSARGIYDNNQHITGAMIVGSRPRDPVVNGEGRSHDHESRFICGTGVMTSCSTVNSTLTGVALALWSAETALTTV